MDAKERFHQDYLAELAALDEFLTRRGEDRRLPIPVDRQDPDVRRLLESVAYLSARTRKLSMDRLERAVERWCQGFFDDLVAPMPAMGLVQARPDGRLVERTHLPRGAELRLVAPDHAAAPFVTTRPLDLLPIVRWQGELKVSPESGIRILLHLECATAMSEFGVLSFYLDHLGDYRASLWFQEALRAHLLGITVRYDAEPGSPPQSPGEAPPADFYFGAPSGEADENDRTPTLGRIRSFFHCPEQDLFLHVAPPPPPRPVRRATLVLQMDGRWPLQAAIDYRQAFQLFVVPVANLYQGPAQPILCDGTRDEYPLFPPSASKESVLYSVLGVYQAGERGLEPLPPSLITGGNATYEVEAVGEDQTRWGHQLHLRIPDAFLKPRRITVQALWYDPWFLSHAHGTLKVRLQTRSLTGVALVLRGELKPHAASPLWGDALKLLHLLALRMKPRLEREDLVLLMDLLGASQDTSYRGLLDLIAEVEVREAADPTLGTLASRGQSGVRLVYKILLREVETENLGALRNFFLQLGMLLGAWLPDPVRLEVRTPDRQPLLLPGAGGEPSA
ncbi:MAG TPA: type VI secretion system baseplate subunit TssF [Polyangia bacterium]|jgi:type VI secretion system protein ImpG|nr:type VI secretion system baseplate subunit TssF [Polyangia bacterium]